MTRSIRATERDAASAARDAAATARDAAAASRDAAAAARDAAAAARDAAAAARDAAAAARDAAAAARDAAAAARDAAAAARDAAAAARAAAAVASKIFLLPPAPAGRACRRECELLGRRCNPLVVAGGDLLSRPKRRHKRHHKRSRPPLGFHPGLVKASTSAGDAVIASCPPPAASMPLSRPLLVPTAPASVADSWLPST